jgi:hypothetical protein
MKLTFASLCLLAVLTFSQGEYASAQTLFYLTGNPGYLALGTTQTDSSANGWSISASINSQEGVTFEINGPGYPSSSDTNFELDLASLSQTQLQPGLYTNATRYPFNYISYDSPSTWTNGLSLAGEGRGDNTLTGEFLIFQATYSGGAVTSFAADFIQNDPGNPTSQDYGSIRYNSSIPLDVETGTSYTLVPEPTVAPLLVLGMSLLGGCGFLRRARS